jgi:SAM-dependent methyltransferase
MKEIKPEEDAFGQEIWAQYDSGQSFEVIEREDGYIDVGDPKLYFSEYKDWAPFEQKSMEFVKGRILDIGCGAGRHALY